MPFFKTLVLEHYLSFQSLRNTTDLPIILVGQGVRHSHTDLVPAGPKFSWLPGLSLRVSWQPGLCLSVSWLPGVRVSWLTWSQFQGLVGESGQRAFLNYYLIGTFFFLF